MTPRQKTCLKIIAALAALLVFAPSPGLAAPACAVTTTGLAFGDVTTNLIGNTAKDITGTLSVACTGLTSNKQYWMCIDIDDYNATTTNRSMASGANALTYQIYSDSARTVPWLDTATGAYGPVTFTTASGSTTFSTSATMYARLLTGQNTAPVGSYSQTLSSANNASYVVQQTTSPGSCNFTTNPSTFSFSSTASVTATCNVSAAALNFGSGTLLSTAALATSNIAVTCTSGTAYTVGLNAGLATGATVTTRKMTSGANTLNYSLYRNSARTQNWGNTAGVDTVAGTGTGGAMNSTVFGTVPQQAAAPGSYTDTITVTVTY